MRDGQGVVGVDGVRLVQKHRPGSMETAFLEFLAAATGAGIVPPDLAARVPDRINRRDRCFCRTRKSIYQHIDVI